MGAKVSYFTTQPALHSQRYHTSRPNLLFIRKDIILHDPTCSSFVKILYFHTTQPALHSQRYHTSRPNLLFHSQRYHTSRPNLLFIRKDIILHDPTLLFIRKDIILPYDPTCSSFAKSKPHGCACRFEEEKLPLSHRY